MRLPSAAHTSRPWRIHAVARDFRLEDVWALPTPGARGDFPRLVRLVTAGEPGRGAGSAASALFALRRRLGALLGWDRPDAGGAATLRPRVPPELRAEPVPARSSAFSFTPLYATDEEYAAEIANRTVHAVMHLGWVADDDGGGRYHGQMAVLVKPRGLLGHAYMAAILPFRRVVVYPALLRSIERRWSAAR